MIQHTIVVRSSDSPRGDEIDAVFAEILGELKAELADGAELLCLSCAAPFVSIEEFGASVIRPDAGKGGNFGAVCRTCAETATNDVLIGIFDAEGRPRC